MKILKIAVISMDGFITGMWLKGRAQMVGICPIPWNGRFFTML